MKAGLENEADLTLEGPPITEGPGTTIGRYELLELIGEGGMGLVYIAEQRSPVRRQVALKVIKPGMDSKRVIARFEAERQVLALLEHPNIAHVFDAGATELGRPYFVMEYVKGMSITEYCDHHKLSIEERLKCFLQVCDGIQYAHQKGIIHRDIKSSNILVSVQTDKAVPKIIDFGVAKAISQPLTERTLYTEQGQLLGTPEYMSPEQAEMKTQDIDTRSDIYSLGVVLYVLLTGVLPFDPETLREGGIDDIRKVICEEEPETPSMRLRTLGEEDSTKVAQHRRCDFVTLQRRLRGDLDWIALKAMEKDRARRYGSAGEFAADIWRHLTHEPILARPRSTIYRVEKFLRRNRVTVTAVTAVAAALVVGLITSATMYLQKKHALDALIKLETAVEADRNLSTVQRLCAEGRYQAALSEMEKYLQRKDAGPKGWLLYAHLLFDLDKFDKAAAELEKLVTGPSEIAGAAHYLLAKIYIGADPNKAKEHHRLGESLLPETAEAYSLRGMTASTPEATIRWLSKALELDPSHYPSRKARALAFYALRDYPKMAHDVEAIIVMRPKDSLGYALRAIVRRQMSRLDEAIKDHDYAIKTCDVETGLAELYDQRRETYVRMGNYKAALRDAERSVELAPGEFSYKFHVFTALVFLGEYEAAKHQYTRVVTNDPQHSWQFTIRAVRHVFKVLGIGQSLELPEQIAVEAPFSAMQEAANQYHKIDIKATRLVTSVFGQSSWSPDGKQLAYGRTDQYEWPAQPLTPGVPAIYGSSGIEILDLETGKTRLVVTSGKDPAWSPDGQYIAFVREPYRRRDYKEEVWLIATHDGEPRRLALGAWPIWASDSKRLLFHSREQNVLCSIRVDDPTSEPDKVISCPGLFPGISPDEKYVAYAVGNELRIAEIATGSVIGTWIAPGPEKGMIIRWSPDGKEILVAGFHCSDLGLWSYDVKRKEAWQLFETPAMSANLPSDRSKISVQLRTPHGELWLATLDPQIPIYKAVIPSLAQHEFMRHRCEQYIQSAKNGTLNSGTHHYLGKFKGWMSLLGTNLYRIGKHEEAFKTLTAADELRSALGEESRPSDVAFTTMSLHQLGRTDEAQAALARLRSLCKDEQFADDGEAQAVLRETEKLLAGEKH
jgi:serine/threonine protein kinase